MKISKEKREDTLDLRIEQLDKRNAEIPVRFSTKGNIEIKTFNIYFVSLGMIREYNKLKGIESAVLRDFSKRERIRMDLEDAEKQFFLGTLSDDEYKKLIKEKTEEVDGLSRSKAVRDAEDIDFLSRRMQLIQKILEKNGYEYDADWWEEDAESADITAFLESAVWKDDKKKAKKVKGAK